MTKNLKLALVSLLSVTLVGCGNKPVDDDSNNPSQASVTEESLPDPVDLFDNIPQRVREYKGDLDIMLYIEGQNGTMEDIGRSTYTPKDISSFEMASWFGAARAWKEISPGTKINIIFCNIADYRQRVNDYYAAHGHLPQLMWSTDHVVEMMQDGLYADLSEYETKDGNDLYASFNEYAMTRFNYGGFQGAIPIAMEPWGVFVNRDALDTYHIVDTNDEDAYKDWVDNFTWDEFMDACRESTTDTHAGLSKVVDYLVSYSVESINKQFIKEASVDLDNDIVKDLIEKENELTNYTVYDYSLGYNNGSLSAKEAFAGAYPWYGTRNVAEDQFCTFYAEAPWALSTISQHIKSNHLTTRVDYLPYPKVDSDTPAYTGIAVEGLGVGNLCPINTQGVKECKGYEGKGGEARAMLEQDVAAYFAMFYAVDARSIQSRSQIHFIHNDIEYEGAVALPLVKKGYEFNWQIEHPELDERGDYGNFEYQMLKYFEVNNAYVTDDEEPDVYGFSNITYGLQKILDTVYGDEITTINYWNEPVQIPADGGTTRNIFSKWLTRYNEYNLGDPTYPSACIAKLAEAEEDINANIEIAWDYIQEMLEAFYEEGKYNALDHSTRNNY